MDWFRSHNGAPTDPKWRVIAKNAGVRFGDVAAIVWALLDYASQNEDRGSIAGFDVETLAVTFDYDETQIVAVIDALRHKGVLEEFRFAQWEKRQPKREDSSAERVRAHRKRAVTQRNAPDKIRLERESVGETTSPPAPARRSNPPLEVDEAMREWGSREAPHVDLDAELAKHLDWKLAKAKHFRDPRAAFRNWCRTAEKDALKTLAAQPRGSPARDDGFLPRRPADIDQRRLEGFHRTGVWAEGWGPKPVGDAAKRGAA